MFTRRQVEENLRAKNKELEDQIDAVRDWLIKWKPVSRQDMGGFSEALKELEEILGESHQSTPTSRNNDG